MDRRLYDASLHGNVDDLNKLIQEDPLILQRTSTTSLNETPLHIAAMCGHLNFVKAILKHDPKLACELDSMGHSPLHFAAAKGYLGIVRALLHACPDVAFVKDQDGRMPLHFAAIKGNVDVLRELYNYKPEAARLKLYRGETVLHLCVEHNRLDALKLLVHLIGQNDELIVSPDCDGNTILHVAASLKKVETIKYLLSKESVKDILDAKNAKGHTAIEMVEVYPKDMTVMEIQDYLRNSKECEGKGRISNILNIYDRNSKDWVQSNKSNLIVVATLTATIAFQAGVNPPGGVWQDFATNDDLLYSYKNSETNMSIKTAKSSAFYLRYNITHIPGSPLLNSIHPDLFQTFLATNNVSLVSSLGIILLMISGFPLTNKLAMWLLVVAMTLTVVCTALSYAIVVSGTSSLSDYFPFTVDQGRYWNWLDVAFQISESPEVIVPMNVILIVNGALLTFHTSGVIAWLVKDFYNWLLDTKRRNPRPQGSHRPAL